MRAAPHGMSSHQGFAGGVSALAVLSIIVMGGAVAFPLHVAGSSDGRLGGAKVTALQFGNETTSSSFTSYNTTTSSSTTQPSTTSSISTTSSSSTTTVRSTLTNSTTSLTTTSNSTRTTTSNSTTTRTFTNSTTTRSNSTTTHTFTNSTSSTTTTRSVNSTTTGSATNATLIQNATTKWDPYTDFYNFLNYGLFADGGDCYGFSTTSILYFSHYALGDQTDPYYPVPTSQLSSLLGQTNTDTLTQVTFPIYIHQHFDPNNLILNSPNEAAQVASLTSTIRSGSPVVLLMGPSDGHAIVAWGYSEYSNGNLVINVSDPNFGNVPRTAYYTNGQFSYTGVGATGSYTWTSFQVAVPGALQWAWLALAGVPVSQLGVVADQTNPYYTYVFSDTPIAIITSAGLATFNTPGDSQSFNSTTLGVVGFEEGSIQVYGVPVGVNYTISDPGGTASSLVVVVPQSENSIVGYQLSSTSTTPISATVTPGTNGLSISTKNEISLSLGVFSIGAQGRSVLNATAIPISGSQKAVLTIPDWSNLNSSTTAASVQVFSPGNSQAVTSYTLTNGQNGVPTPTGVSPFMLLVVAIAAVVVVAFVMLVYLRHGKAPKANR